MAKYIVLPIALSVKNNRVAKANQMVDDSELNTNASELISEGFLRVATEKEIEDYNNSIDTVVDEIDEEEEEEDDDLESILNSRKEKLKELGFSDVDLEDFKGLSFADSGVNFSNEDISNATLEEFDAFIAKAKELNAPKDSKEDDSKKPSDNVSKKDQVKDALTKK